MINDNVWDYTDWRGEALPKPVHWDDHPEWFNEFGYGIRIPGPRFLNTQGGKDEKPWHWGPTEWVRDIGEFVVLCFRWDKSGFGKSQQTEHGVLGYQVWVDGVEVDQVHESLDQALVDAVRFKHEGRRGSSGPRATEYFFRMISVPE